MKLVLFTSKTCGICTALKPKLEEVVKNYDQSIEFTTIDVVESPEQAASYGVFTLPVLLLEIDGREFARWKGSFSLMEVQQTIDRFRKLMK